MNALLTVLVGSLLSIAAPDEVTGRDFRELSHDAQTVYLYGYMNGVSALGRVSVLAMVQQSPREGMNNPTVRAWVAWFDYASATFTMEDLRERFIATDQKVSRAYAELVLPPIKGDI